MRAIILFAFVIVVVISTIRIQGFDNRRSRLSSSQQDGMDTEQNFQRHVRANDDYGSNYNNDYNRKSPSRRVPFPQCLVSKSASRVLNPSSLQKMFEKQLADGEQNLKYESKQNYNNKNRGVMDYDTYELRNGESEGQKTAVAALRLTKEIMTVLMCDLNGTDSQNLNTFLNNFEMPEKFCSYLAKPSCDGMTLYRTITGVCNNVDNPYQGSSHTAFARLKPANYADGLGEPRTRSVRGGLLPSCRQLSLDFGSKPNFDRSFNNLWVIFGQFVAHDMALALPVSDTYQTPISSCGCNSKRDYDRCTVIDIDQDDPYLAGQKCMAFPATAQAFPDQICSLGVKEQMNGNTHFLDASPLYGSTQKTSLSLRATTGGALKSQQPSWSQMELPPGQREPRSCVDATPKRRCFAAGDSRIMENGLLSGIHTMLLRFHNLLAQDLAVLQPTWFNDKLYEETRKLVIGVYQNIIYTKYLPVLFGNYPITFNKDVLFSTYNNATPAVVYNEVATAAFRCHSFVRDLFSRCTSNSKLIDQLWLNDISHKVKYAYDMENNGFDALVCGALYDYGFAGDTNFAQQIHNQLFETTTKSGEKRANDLIAINICRGREHGLPVYNTFRELAGYTKAYSFEDFHDTINYDGIQKLRKQYKDPNDVDLFVGINREDRSLGGGLIGPVTAFLLNEQFNNLKYGDRLFYTHTGQFTHDQLTAIQNYPFHCFICQTTSIQQVAQNPFKSPDEINNPLVACDTCAVFDLTAWSPAVYNP